MSNPIENLKSECLDCRKCGLGGCIQNGKPANVFSNMNVDARVMVVGRSPGHSEIEEDEPFAGRSGKFFKEALADMCGIDESKLYFTNTVKCFIPDDRKPRQKEMDACRHFLDSEIAIIKPAIIVALGAQAFKSLTGMSRVSKHYGELTYSVKYCVHVLPLPNPSPQNTNNPERLEILLSGLRELREFYKGYKHGG